MNVIRTSKTGVDLKLIFHLLSLTLLFESIFLIIDLIICFIYDHSSIMPIVLSLLVTSGVGFLVFSGTQNKKGIEPTRKESIALVVFTWILLSLFGTLPYMFSGSISNFTNALFESVSGFTTTGASILEDVEVVPRGILFWRSETHWIGGMGIILLMLAILPFFKTGAVYLLSTEGSSVLFEKLKPKLIDTMKRLWGIYILLTIIEIILLNVGGMNLFDSICHSFGTVATGGFSTKNTSIGGYSTYIQVIITIFMILSGINFILHYYFIKRKFLKVIADEELGLYLGIFITASVLIAFNLYKDNHLSIFQSFKESSFQVASILSTTGFSTSDYNIWSSSSKVIILVLMLFGGCAGSTSGGIKIIRYVLAWKNITFRTKKALFQNMVEKIKFNGVPIERSQMIGIIEYILIYYGIIVIGVVILQLIGLNIPTSVGSVATCLGGIGPGFDLNGPASNYAMIPSVGKYTLIVLMIFGRLEIFSVILIFTRSFWKI